MPNISEEKKEKRNAFQGTKFFLTLPYFDEIENVVKYLNWYKDGSLQSKTKEIPYFIERNKAYKFNPGLNKAWFKKNNPEYLTNPTGELYNFHSLKDYAVVLETHTKDEAKGKHLHIYIEFEKQREISPSHFDFLGKHGNLQKVRSEIATLQYMQKENDVIASFDVIDRMLAKAKRSNEIKKLIFDLIVFRDWQPSQVNNKFGSKVTQVNILQLFKIAKQSKMDLTEKVRFEWMKSNRIRKITRELIEKRLTLTELGLFDSFPIYQQLIDVVNRLLVKGNNHDHKQCTIALVGEPSIGKSTFADTLAKHFATYYFPLDNWHQGEYINEIYEIWVWHEWDFRIISKSDFLLLTEGAKCDLRVKFAKTTKLDRPLLILTSNEKFEDQCKEKFKRKLDLQSSCINALKVRIQEFDFGDKPMHFLTKLLVNVNEDI